MSKTIWYYQINWYGGDIPKRIVKGACWIYTIIHNIYLTNNLGVGYIVIEVIDFNELQPNLGLVWEF